MEELCPASGYLQNPERYHFDASYTGQEGEEVLVFRQEVRNTQTSVSVSKRDLTNGEELEGSELAVIEKETGKKIDVISLSYNRLMNHIKYMVARAMTGEDLRINMNEYIESKFPEAYMTAKKVCDMLGKSIGKELDEMEIGYLAMHIERIYSEEIKA